MDNSPPYRSGRGPSLLEGARAGAAREAHPARFIGIDLGSRPSVGVTFDVEVSPEGHRRISNINFES